MKCRRFRLENGEGVGDRDEVKLLISSVSFYIYIGYPIEQSKERRRHYTVALFVIIRCTIHRRRRSWRIQSIRPAGISNTFSANVSPNSYISIEFLAGQLLMVVFIMMNRQIYSAPDLRRNGPRETAVLPLRRPHRFQQSGSTAI